MFKLAVYFCKYVFVFISLYFQYYNYKAIRATVFIDKRTRSKRNGSSSKTFKASKSSCAESIPVTDKYANRQFILLCIFHAIACCILNKFLLGAIALAFFAAAFVFVKLAFGRICRILWNNVFFLMDIGLIALMRIKPVSAERQLLWFAVGFSVALTCRFLIRRQKKDSHPLPFPLSDSTDPPRKRFPFSLLDLSAYFFTALTPALLVLPFFFGVTINGANNWITFYGHSFQPSEIAKITLTLSLAGLLSFEHISIPRALFVCGFSALCVLILVMQRDLGGALIFFTVFLLLLYTASGNKLLVLSAVLLASLAAAASYFVFPHISVRVTAWLNPWSDASGSGYQILQSLFAIGTWGPMGSGLSLGMPGFIPVAESDFIFAAITEEFGVFFALGIICSFIFILYFGLQSAKIQNTKLRNNQIKSLVAIGLSVLLAFQAFLIMGGCVRLIPITGVTLPFVSYGGSSMIVCLIIIGILSRLGDINPCFAYSPPIAKSTDQIESLSIFDRMTRAKLPNLHNTRAFYLLYLLYILVIIFLLKFAFIDSEGVTANSYNPRMRVNDSNISRGNIYDRYLRPLATNDGSLRVYPYAEKTAHIVGYLARGGAGAESRYNFELQKPGAEAYQRIVNTLTGDLINADNIVLTIDAELNSLIYDRLSASGLSGAAVVMEPSTGRILAIVSAPGYDPNSISDLWSNLSSDEKNSPLMNRATQGLYPPGSIFKIITATAAIRSGIGEGSDQSFDCTGELDFGNGIRLRCYNQNIHGLIDLPGAFRVSCNGYFADIVLNIGAQALFDSAQRAMFNAPLSFPLSYKQSSFVLNTGSSTHEIIQTAIGQGKTLVSPLHMAMLTSAVANGGIMMQPYILDHVLSNGKQTKQTVPQKLTDAFTLDQATTLTNMMVEVVNNGTGTAAAISGIKVAGKTGTAENPAGDDHGWFVAFAPADKPTVALAILLENSDGPRGAMTIAHEIIKYVLGM